MHLISKGIETTLLTVLLCAGLSTVALAVDREVYDWPHVQPGKIIDGKIMRMVGEKSSQTWNVSVKDRETGQVIVLHLDRTTQRKDNMLSPDIGDNVIAKYNEVNHAISFLTDENINR